MKLVYNIHRAGGGGQISAVTLPLSTWVHMVIIGQYSRQTYLQVTYQTPQQALQGTEVGNLLPGVAEQGGQGGGGRA